MFLTSKDLLFLYVLIYGIMFYGTMLAFKWPNIALFLCENRIMEKNLINRIIALGCPEREAEKIYLEYAQRNKLPELRQYVEVKEMLEVRRSCRIMDNRTSLDKAP